MRVGERVAGRGSGCEGLGGLRTECRHGWRGRRAQGRGRSVWRGGKGREGEGGCSLVEVAVRVGERVAGRGSGSEGLGGLRVDLLGVSV